MLFINIILGVLGFGFLIIASFFYGSSVTKLSLSIKYGDIDELEEAKSISYMSKIYFILGVTFSLLAFRSFIF